MAEPSLAAADYDARTTARVEAMRAGGERGWRGDRRRYRACIRVVPHRERRGLAMMELVLWLPVLLFVVALIINYGTMATWRVRGEIVSHDAAFRARWGRSGGTEGRLAGEWPADATITTAADSPLTELDAPYIQHPVVRGPLPNGFVVRPILDPDHEGAYKGVGRVARDYPLLPRLGDYDSGEIAGPLVDRKWTNTEMGIPNIERRIPVLYQLPRTDPRLPREFVNAVNAVLSIPHFAALAVLDNDADIRKFYGQPHDFHPRVHDVCELDPDVVQRTQVNRLVDTRNDRGEIVLGEISGLPRTMTNFFLNMYRAAVDMMEQRIQQLQDELRGPPPPTPQRQAEIMREIADLQAEIQRIQPLIRQLEAYLNRMPQIEADLRARADAAIP